QRGEDQPCRDSPARAGKTPGNQAKQTHPPSRPKATAESLTTRPREVNARHRACTSSPRRSAMPRTSRCVRSRCCAAPMPSPARIPASPPSCWRGTASQCRSWPITTTMRHERLRRGEAIALVSDAGTPLVSDPGFKLVREAIAERLPVTTLPGPSAALAGLVLSGLPSDRFLFAGFLPPKAAARRHALTELAAVPATLVFFEGASRLADTLGDMAETL